MKFIPLKEGAMHRMMKQLAPALAAVALVVGVASVNETRPVLTPTQSETSTAAFGVGFGMRGGGFGPRGGAFYYNRGYPGYGYSNYYYGPRYYSPGYYDGGYYYQQSYPYYYPYYNDQSYWYP